MSKIPYALLTLIIVSMMTGSAWGASGAFKISDYIPEKFTDFQWKVDGSVGMSGGDATSLDSATNPYQVVSDRTNDSDSRGVDIGSSMNYRYETPQRFLTTDIGLSLSGNRSSSKTSQTYTQFLDSDSRHSDNSASSYWGELSANADVGQYVSGDFFVSSIFDFRYQYNEIPNDHRKTKDVHDLNNYGGSRHLLEIVRSEDLDVDERSVAFEIRATPGWGHMYEGGYSSTAMYLVDELQKEGLLSGQVSTEHMFTLCDTIYRYRLQHSVDKRLHRIEALNAILSFLQAKGYTPDMGPYGYLLVQDVWDYFPRSGRRFGSRIRVGIGTRYIHDSRHISSTEHNEALRTQYHPDTPNVIDTVYISSSDVDSYEYQKHLENDTYLTAMLEYSVPFRRQWQIDFNAVGHYYLHSEVTYEERPTNDVDTTTRINREYNDRYDVSFSGILSYIVNSRTTLSTRLNYRHNHDQLSSDFRRVSRGSRIYITEYWSGESNQFDISSNLTYRLSIPTSLYASVKYGWNDSASEDLFGANESDGSKYSFSVSLSHYLY
ncbi:MAG: hypothetical protein KOO62_10310 [candidate division Zixibacteria bacterium]|nr:hypothetical protein [candidate division Zixibacteria bacterium]